MPQRRANQARLCSAQRLTGALQKRIGILAMIGDVAERASVNQRVVDNPPEPGMTSSGHIRQIPAQTSR